MEPPPRSAGPPAETLRPRGEGSRNHGRVRAWARAPKRARFGHILPLNFALFFSHLRKRLAGMARMAQGLEIVAICEQCHIAPVRTDVVNLRGTDAPPLLGAGPAIGLPQQLAWTQLPCPDRELVELVPCSAVRAAPIRSGGLVLCAIAARHQHAAAGMPTRSHGFLAQGYHLLARQKRRRP